MTRSATEIDRQLLRSTVLEEVRGARRFAQELEEGGRAFFALSDPG